eukprot:2065592-Lingulodinium_polyedra.AAC.1
MGIPLCKQASHVAHGNHTRAFFCCTPAGKSTRSWFAQRITCRPCRTALRNPSWPYDGNCGVASVRPCQNARATGTWWGRASTAHSKVALRPWLWLKRLLIASSHSARVKLNCLRSPLRRNRDGILTSS